MSIFPIQRETARICPGRFDSLGGYVRWRFGGSGICFRRADEKTTYRIEDKHGYYVNYPAMTASEALRGGGGHFYPVPREELSVSSSISPAMLSDGIVVFGWRLRYLAPTDRPVALKYSSDWREQFRMTDAQFAALGHNMQGNMCACGAYRPKGTLAFVGCDCTLCQPCRFKAETT